MHYFRGSMTQVKGTWKVQRFGSMGEKTGWTYISITAEEVQLLYPGNKQSFRVKGVLNGVAIHQQALMPMGEGAFILPLNADLRKQLGVRLGYTVQGSLEKDATPVALSTDLLACLADEPEALAFFKSLTPGHQRYFSGWIDGAKTDATKARRIALTVQATARKMGYSEMIREEQARRKQQKEL
jgi:hypothetical protein